MLFNWIYLPLSLFENRHIKFYLHIYHSSLLAICFYGLSTYCSLFIAITYFLIVRMLFFLEIYSYKSFLLIHTGEGWRSGLIAILMVFADKWTLRTRLELQHGCPISKSEPLCIISPAPPSLQQLLFLNYHPSRYWRGLTFLNFGDVREAMFQCDIVIKPFLHESN